MCSDKNLFDVYFSYYLNCFSSFVVVTMKVAFNLVSEVRVPSSYLMSFDENLFVSFLVFWYPLRGGLYLI